MSAPTYIDINYATNCTYNGKRIGIELKRGNAVDALITINFGETVVSGTYKHVFDADGKTGGHYIYENSTSTVWYVAPRISKQHSSAG
jgi:hypothetical protein